MPAPLPVASPGTTAESINEMKPETVSQNEMLFIRGKAMSGAPIMIGTNQLPKPPMIAGMTRKNTMIRPWAVIRTFHRCSWASKLAEGSPRIEATVPRYWMPGWASSRRMMPEIAPPITPAKIAKIR